MITATPSFVNPQYQVNVEAIRQGYRWCISCGTPAINPGEPTWKTRCTQCWIVNRESRGLDAISQHCRRCGVQIDRQAQTSTLLRDFCSKRCALSESACGECGVYHPAGYHR